MPVWLVAKQLHIFRTSSYRLLRRKLVSLLHALLLEPAGSEHVATE